MCISAIPAGTSGSSTEASPEGVLFTIAELCEGNARGPGLSDLAVSRFSHCASIDFQQFPLEQKSNKMGRIAYGGRIGRWQI